MAPYVVPAKRRQIEREQLEKKKIERNTATPAGNKSSYCKTIHLSGLAEVSPPMKTASLTMPSRGNGTPSQAARTTSFDPKSTAFYPLLHTPTFHPLTWHDMALSAETEPTSLFGRLRSLAELNFLSPTTAAKTLAIATLFTDIWMVNRHLLTSRTIGDCKRKVNFHEWKWSDLDLDAEDRPDSMAGAMDVLIELGVLKEECRRELRGLGREVAGWWLSASSVEDIDDEGDGTSGGNGEFQWQLEF